MKYKLILFLFLFGFLNANTILSEKGNSGLSFQTGIINSRFYNNSIGIESSYTFKFGLQLGGGFQHSNSMIWPYESDYDYIYNHFTGSISLNLLDHNRRKFPFDIWANFRFVSSKLSSSYIENEHGIFYSVLIKRNFHLNNDIEIIPQLYFENLTFYDPDAVERGYGQTFFVNPQINLKYKSLYAYVKYIPSIPFAGLSIFAIYNTGLQLGVGIILDC